MKAAEPALQSLELEWGAAAAPAVLHQIAASPVLSSILSPLPFIAPPPDAPTNPRLRSMCRDISYHTAMNSRDRRGPQSKEETVRALCVDGRKPGQVCLREMDQRPQWKPA